MRPCPIWAPTSRVGKMRQSVRLLGRAAVFPGRRASLSLCAPSLRRLSSSTPEPKPVPLPDPPAAAPSLSAGTWPVALSKSSITVDNADSWYSSGARWTMPPVMACVHLSVGSVYTWSMWNMPLAQTLGVVAASKNDWSLPEVLSVFSCTAATLGVTMFTLGPWGERAGPRMISLFAGTSYAAGWATTALGVHLHSLPLLYGGFGVLGGMGFALGYLTPFSTIMRWFPERRGLASGMAATSFGLGAVVGAPMIKYLLDKNFVAPTYLGTAAEVAVQNKDGSLYAANANGDLVEVVVAAASDIKQIGHGLAEGVYVVGTGDNGVVPTMLTLAATYWTACAFAASAVRLPAVGWWPEGAEAKSAEDADLKSGAVESVDYNQALFTPQYYMLLTLVMGNAAAGITLIASAKTIMTDCFAAALPAIVTPALTTQYVSAIGMANSGGRAIWAFSSDYLGSKNTYNVFALGIPAAISVPLLAHNAQEGGVQTLYMFGGATLLSVSFYGGLLSCLPPYIGRTFGPAHVGAIHGRILAGWSIAATCGPQLFAYTRGKAKSAAIDDLASKCDPKDFEAAFGAGLDQLEGLKAANTATIPRLLELCPEGTPDPTPFLYDVTYQYVTGLLCLSACANLMMRPAIGKAVSAASK